VLIHHVDKALVEFPIFFSLDAFALRITASGPNFVSHFLSDVFHWNCARIFYFQRCMGSDYPRTRCSRAKLRVIMLNISHFGSWMWADRLCVPKCGSAQAAIQNSVTACLVAACDTADLAGQFVLLHPARR
jgi:hypothetical protein